MINHRKKVLCKAKEIFAILHQRFIQTPQGMELMKDKILKGDIGFCPAVNC